MAINDVADPVTLAALLRQDSVYGRFPAGRVGGGRATVDGAVIPVLSETALDGCPGRTWW